MLVPKNLPEGPSEVCNRTGLVLGQLAGLRLPVRIVLWPMVMQAFNPTMRPGVLVLCRVSVTDRWRCHFGVCWRDRRGLDEFDCLGIEMVLVWLLVCAHDPLGEPLPSSGNREVRR